jgi:hypothetical protein
MLRNQTICFIATFLTGCIGLLIPSKVLAQYNYYSSPSFSFNQNNYPPIGATYSRGSSTKKPVKRPTSNQTDRTTTNQTGRISATNNPLPYIRNRTLSAKIREEFLQDLAKQLPPDEAKGVRELIEKNDVVQVLAGFARLQGLNSSKKEDLLAFWYGQQWAVANQQPLPSLQQYKGIASQLQISISQSSIAKMDNTELQTFFEQLAYPQVIQKANYQAYRKYGKQDSINRMSKATREGLKKIGIDFQNMRLTDDGFTKS